MVKKIRDLLGQSSALPMVEGRPVSDRDNASPPAITSGAPDPPRNTNGPTLDADGEMLAAPERALLARMRLSTLEAQLREANEHLIVASLQARAMNEASSDMALKMSYLAQHDVLTDLPNRSLFNDRLIQATALAQRHGRKTAVLFLDLDRFKHVNDSTGHPTGDRLLQAVAKRLLKCVRASDSVSRQGGDEFMVLLWEVAQASDAALVAEKILRALNAPFPIDEHNLHISTSIGIATFPNDGTDAESLIRHADLAMYSAKNDGGNRYQFFTSEMNDRVVERQSLESGLRPVLERQQLELHYQPQLDFRSGAIVGAEALIRWRHPDRGFIPPAKFLPVAEECGLMVPIGRWVLREACSQARAWQNARLKPIRVAVNMSAAELRAEDVVPCVETILTETNLDPHYLEIELTETFLLQYPDSTAAVLQALKSMGIQIALDDFGTGYSSLSYLKRFPIDTLKIDRSFVRDVVTDADDASIVNAIIGMGRDLNMRVVAEGVETQDQLTFLQERHCPEGQGYYFSRPVVAERFAQLLSNGCETSVVPDVQ